MNIETIEHLYNNQVKPIVDQSISEKSVLRAALLDRIPWQTVSSYCKETVEVMAYQRLFNRVLDEAVRAGVLSKEQAIDASMIVSSWGSHWCEQWKDETEG